MAIYNLKIEHDRGRSAVNRYDYIFRLGKYSAKENPEYDDFLYGENVNLPDKENQNAREFWESADSFERKNGNSFRTIDFSLPCELTNEENIELAKKFAQSLFGDKYVYSLAIHSKDSNDINKKNIHCHITFSERELDGIERNNKTFFKRYNPKNPAQGGAKKNSEWVKYRTLYKIRNLWEQIANEKLEEKGIEKISSKSLKRQRLEALINEDYLRAEVLNRPAVNLDSKYKFVDNSDKKNMAIEFFEYAKKIKQMKEINFKLKAENYEKENQLAKQRLINEVLEDNNSINLTEIFYASVDNAVLIERRKNRLDMIANISDEDIEKRAINNFTKGEYYKKKLELDNINEFYDSLENKELFKFEMKKNELEKYFRNIHQSKEFRHSIPLMKEKIIEKYKQEIYNIQNDLNFLEKNNFKNFYLKDNPYNRERKNYLFKIIRNKLPILKENLNVINEKVKKYKENNSLKFADIKLEIIENIKPGMKEKYIELDEWKNQFKISYNDVELYTRIKKREKGLKQFEIENNIYLSTKELLEKRRNEYKELRQEQDDSYGRLAYSYNLLKELNKVKELDYNDDIKSLETEKNNANSFMDKIKYNVKLSQIKRSYFNKKIELEKFTIDSKSLTKEEKECYKKEAIINIQKLKDELSELEKTNNMNIDEEAKYNILNKKSMGVFEKTQKKIKNYEKLIEKGISIDENTFMINKIKEELGNLEKAFPISNNELVKEKMLILDNNLSKNIRIKNIKKEIAVNIGVLKALSKKKIMKIRLSNLINPLLKKLKPRKTNDIHLKVVNSGRIDFEDEEKRKKLLKEYEI